MAKKKRRIIEEPEEEYEFTPTEFNEREFILKETYSSRIFFLSMGMAVVIGIIAAILIKTFPMESNGFYMSSIIATIISFAGLFLIRKVAGMLGLHPELIEVKSMAGTYIMYLAMALAVCIIGVQF
ncbi:MAG: hypothetical protein J6U12_00830 [Candidatus Methanomethylophilaceae archaeon]|jgi:hypothetical protein|nr:hypothetical protein [Candidatus Methanomethylophilaceae archaeon]MBP5686046.1 hypothetical protein [Candidatus Methanomethylophilaceae archaeon]MBP5735822.1 hypothetical protein [Candidatus Methanomethylophilaceae archaeon]